MKLLLLLAIVVVHGAEQPGKNDCHVAVVFAGETYGGLYHYYCQNAHAAVQFARQQCSKVTTIFVRNSGYFRNENVAFDYILERERVTHDVSDNNLRTNIVNMFHSVYEGLELAQQLGAQFALRTRIDLRMDSFTSENGFLNVSEVYGHTNPRDGNHISDNVLFGSVGALREVFSPKDVPRSSPENIVQSRIRRASLTFVQTPISVYLIKPARAHIGQRSTGVRHWSFTRGNTFATHRGLPWADLPASFRAPVPEDICHNTLVKVAVCISGQLRTFLEKDVQQRLSGNFNVPGYFYFLSTSGPETLLNVSSDARLKVQVAHAFVDNGTPVLVSTDGYACTSPGRFGHVRMYPMAQRWAACYAQLAEYERSHGFLFDWVARVRTDFMYLERIPPVYELFRNYSAEGADVLLYDDHMSIGPRSTAVSQLVTPQQVYRTCPDLNMWVKACAQVGSNGAHSRASYIQTWLNDLPSAKHNGRTGGGTAPCCPLNLIAWYDDVSVRQCGFVQHTPCLPRPCSIVLAKDTTVAAELSASCSGVH